MSGTDVVKSKINKLVQSGMNEYDAARQVIDGEKKALVVKAEAIKKKLNA